MKNLIKPASLLLYVLSVLVFFVFGLYIAKFTGAGKNQMLAGGAIVLFYGMVSAGIALIASIFFALTARHDFLIRVNKILSILFFIIVGIIVYTIQTREKKNENAVPPNKTTVPVDQSISNISYMSITREAGITITPFESDHFANEDMGIGFFKPNFLDYPTLNFYGGVNLEKSLDEHMPMDSLVFTNDEHGTLTTSYAPPWLYPQHLKLDYGIIIFKVLGVGYDFIKVESNKETGQITYLDKTQGSYLSWSEFLMSVNSVEFKETMKGAVHIKPLAYSSEVNASYEFMKPLLVQSEWMYVQLVDDLYSEQGKGWIRWRDGSKVLIEYSLLS